MKNVAYQRHFCKVCKTEVFPNDYCPRCGEYFCLEHVAYHIVDGCNGVLRD